MNWPASSTTSISQRVWVPRRLSAVGLVPDVTVMIPGCALTRTAGESLRMMVLAVPGWPGGPLGIPPVWGLHAVHLGERQRRGQHRRAEPRRNPDRRLHRTALARR